MDNVLNQIVAPILGAAVFLAAVSTVAVAIVEFVKALARARLFFHRWALRKWTANSDRTATGLLKDLLNWTSGEAIGAQKIEQPVLGELLLLAAGGHDYDKALYDQPTEKMMAQVQAAANVALEFPNEYPSLYAFLTASDIRDKKLSTAAMATVATNAEVKATSTALDSIPQSTVAEGTTETTVVAPPASSDAAKWRSGMDEMRMSHRTRVESIKLSNVMASENPKNAQTSADETGKARSRLNNLVARKLDTFQNETRYMWDRLNQMIGSGLCCGLIWLTSWALTHERWPNFSIAWFVFGVFGGIAAPFAKDVVAGLSSFAKKA